jgi:jouberin
VFSGSKMGSVHIWRSESGVYIGEYKSSTPGWIHTYSPIVDISFHPHDHVIAFSVWGANEPVMVFTWDEQSAELKESFCIGTKEHLDVDKMVAKDIGDQFFALAS